MKISVYVAIDIESRTSSSQYQGLYAHGKPGKVREKSNPGKVRELCVSSWKNKMLPF